jgi:hypothetical protein
MRCVDKVLFLSLAPCVAVVFAHAQGNPVSPQPKFSDDDRAAARIERRSEGVEASREFKPGEGDPIPEARRKATSSEKAAGRAERKAEGSEAAREFQPGEGDPEPELRKTFTKEERESARKARRAEMTRENKAGRIPSYNDALGGK